MGFGQLELGLGQLVQLSHIHHRMEPMGFEQLELELGLANHIHHTMEQMAAIELALELELANHIHHKLNNMKNLFNIVII